MRNRTKKPIVAAPQIRQLASAAVNFALFRAIRLIVSLFRRHGDRVLVIRSDGIGDFILFTEALTVLTKHFSPTPVDLAVADHCADLAKICPGLDQVIGWSPARFRRNPFYRLTLALRLAKKGYATVISPQFTHEQNADQLACSLAVPRLIGFKISPEASPLVRWVGRSYTETVTPAADLHNEIARGADLLKALGTHLPANGLRSRVHLTEADRHAARELLAPISNSQAVFCLMPGCLHSIREWPRERYIAVARDLMKRYPEKISFVVLGSEKDRPIADAIAQALEPNALNLAGRTTLRVLAAVIEACDMYIGVETGAAHMAMAVETPAAVILGGGHFGRFMPYDGKLRIAHKELDCYGCNWECIREQPDCILGVSAESVLASALELIDEHEILPPDARTSRSVEPVSRQPDRSLDGAR